MITLKHKIFRSIELLLVAGGLLFGAASCQSDEPIRPDEPATSDGTVTIEGSVVIPKMPRIESRALGATASEGLSLTLIEFDMATQTIDGVKVSDPAQSIHTNTYKATITSETTAVANGILVYFKVTVIDSDAPKVLNLIVTDDFITPGFGSEAAVMPNLTVSDGTEAYWGRVEFPDGYDFKTTEEEPVSDFTKKLTAVPMIRNFSQVTVEYRPNEGVTPNFEVLGYDLVNMPLSGTIAPWVMGDNPNFPSLLDGNAMKSFESIKDSYTGILAGGVEFYNQESVANGWNASHFTERGNNPVFLYEHPFEENRRTYIIVYGQYTSPDGVATNGYYKIDLGVVGTGDAAGTFDFYNILRNIHYNVVIGEVKTVGAESVANAISRNPYNNLLASIETSTMPFMSDGTSSIQVEKTNYVLTNTDPVQIKFKYIPVLEDGTVDNTAIDIVGCEPGNVINRVESTVLDSEWAVITIIPNELPAIGFKTQSFYIVDKDGLGRKITLTLRQPFQYQQIGTTANQFAIVQPGSNNSYSTDLPLNKDVSSQAGADFTVYFNLPDGMPESVFPLDFTFEARLQGIENNKVGDLVVQTGTSDFPGQSGKIVIKYMKSVTYNEYKYKYENNTSNNLNLSENNLNTTHTIRARFTTITAEETNNAEILIANPSFQSATGDGYVTVSFNRTASAPTGN